MKRALLLSFVTVLLISFGCSKTPREDLVVAVVDIKEITIGDFERISEVMEDKYLPETDDLEGKKLLLKHIINKEVMAIKAKAAGYEHEEGFISFWKRWKNPFVVAALWEHHVRKKITVTDKMVDAYFEKMQWEFTIRQLVLPEEEDALEMREKIMAGEDFAEMAKKYSLGPASEEGGFVGSSTIGDMHWWIEDTLYEMEEGDVSPPLRTNTGYALIKVERRRKVLPVHDREYAEKRVRAIEEKKGMEALKKKIEKEIEMTWSTDAINIAYDALPDDIPFQDIIDYKVTRENAPELDIPEEYKDMVICQYMDGSFTLRDFEDAYELAGLPSRPRRQYGREHVMQIVHRLIFDEVLPVYAEQMYGILEIPEIKEQLDKRKEEFLVYSLYQDQIADEVAVTERDIEYYYNDHIDEIINPEKRELQLCLVSDRSKAQGIMLRARKGEDFDNLVKIYSEDPKLKESLGKTGLIEEGQFPNFGEAAFSLAAVGDISDPVEIPRGYVVIKLLKIEKSKTPPLLEVAGKIRRKLMEEMAEDILLSKLDIWREDYIVKINEENLAKAELKRLKLAADEATGEE